MKKFVSMILVASMILSMSVTAFAADVNDLAFRDSSVEMDVAETNTDEIIGREYLISEEVLSNGVNGKYTALNHADGSVTYRYYENDVKVREYNVVPGSGQYTVRDYIWTRDDWRNPTLGRLLFWNVYGNEYTPTSWNP